VLIISPSLCARLLGNNGSIGSKSVQAIQHRQYVAGLLCIHTVFLSMPWKSKETSTLYETDFILAHTAGTVVDTVES